MASDTYPCKEKGCKGTVRITTDGNGGTLAICEPCQLRRAHFAEVLKPRVWQPVKCTVCKVPVPRKGTIPPKYCEACAKLAIRLHVLRRKVSAGQALGPQRGKRRAKE